MAARRLTPARLTDEQSQLVNDNIGLCRFLARERSRLIACMTRRELESAAYLAMCNAAVMYKPEMGKFSTYAGSAIHFQISYEIRRVRRKLKNDRVVDLPHFEAFDREICEDERLDIAAWMDALPDRARTAVNQRLDGYTLKEVGAGLGVSREWVRQLLLEALESFSF